MMSFRATLAFSLLAIVISTTLAPIIFAQTTPQANVVASYRNINSRIYDRLRGNYGKDYSYDWDTNTYTNYTNRPTPVQPDSKVLVIDGHIDEDAWNGIQPVTIDLQPMSSFAGAVRQVSVRAINNGSWLFMAFQWKDTTESRQEGDRIKRPDGSFVYNATHFYSDNMFVGWWMRDGPPNVKPYLNANYAGTSMGRVPWNKDPIAKASLWIFKAYYTDDASPYWPSHYTVPRTWRWGPNVGKPLIFPYPHMVETLLNSTANYMIGSGVAHVSGCAFPGGQTFPFDVRSSGKWKDGVWSLEVARPFSPHPLNAAVKGTMKFDGGNTYSIFFGAEDGQHGEDDDTGSISQWYTLYIEPPAQPGIPIWTFATTALAIATISVLIVVYVRRLKKRK